MADDDRAILDLYQRVLSPVREKEEAALFADLDALAGSLFGDPGNDPQPAAPAAPAASYELVQCQQGDAAVDMVTRALEEHRPFAVAFLDIQMPPGPDGVWTAERIRALDPQIELVMVSGYADLHPDDIVRRVPPAHKLLYIQKPFHPQEITHFASALGAKWQAEWKLRQAHNDLVTANEGLLEEIDARKRAETALRKAHDELERRVKERTVELVKANEQLKQEIEEHKQT
ncbi:MAG: response regulator, partial [bacterium]|nr:response regulator [bacterium]